MLSLSLELKQVFPDCFCAIRMTYYGVYHGLRLTKPDDYFFESLLTIFEASIIFLRQLGHYQKLAEALNLLFACRQREKFKSKQIPFRRNKNTKITFSGTVNYAKKPLLFF